MKQKSLFLNSMLMLFTLWEQDRTVSGIVVNEQTGDPLPGVNVPVKRTPQGVVADIGGNHKITMASENSILVYTFIGMSTKQVEVNSQSVIDERMANINLKLDSSIK